MALVFPLSLSDFMSRLPVGEFTFDLGEALEINETLGGDQISADLGPRLWQGRIGLVQMSSEEWSALEPRLETLRQGGTGFLVTDIRRPAPAADPSGAGLGNATPTILELQGDNRQLRLTGLPAGYVLHAGDYIGFTYGTPERHALHRIVDDSVIADINGQTALFEVVPNLRPGTATGRAVALRSPMCRAIIRPGSVSKGSTFKTVTSGVGFDWVQRVRP